MLIIKIVKFQRLFVMRKCDESSPGGSYQRYCADYDLPAQPLTTD
jgi:hypothetical protein